MWICNKRDSYLNEIFEKLTHHCNHVCKESEWIVSTISKLQDPNCGFQEIEMLHAHFDLYVTLQYFTFHNC